MVGISYFMEKKMAGRWIAGPQPSDAISLAKRINKRGMVVLINYLGEEFTSKSDVLDSVNTYLQMIHQMDSERIKGDLSLKPSQLGLKISKELTESSYSKIVDAAKAKGIFVWLDMEGPETVDSIIEVYLKNVKKGNVGICIQAYLKRSANDIDAIVKRGGVIRLVKGAYNLEEGITFSTKREIDENYDKLMEYLFKHSPRFMIATHDPSIINEAVKLNKRYKRNVTYAMLNGINNKAALKIVDMNKNMALYLPFGTRWIAYSYRRLKEGGHVPMLIRSLFSDQTI